MNRTDEAATFRRTEVVGKQAPIKVLRFPRLAVNGLPVCHPKSTEERSKTERALLEDYARRLIFSRRQLHKELGRTFIRIKSTLKHGRWKSYFAENFVPLGIKLRTAQRYMELVNSSKANPSSQNDNLALFKPAGDPQAVKIRDATAQAQVEVGNVQQDKVRLEGIFRLPLLLTIDEQEATRNLIKSQHWPSAQREIIEVLRQLHTRFGFVSVKTS